MEGYRGKYYDFIILMIIFSATGDQNIMLRPADMNNDLHIYVFDVPILYILGRWAELSAKLCKRALYFGINYIIVTLLHYFEDYDSNLSLALPKLVLRVWIYILLIPLP